MILQLNGHLGEASLDELEQSIDAARHSHQELFIDLSEVTLVDRKAAAYLSEKAQDGVHLINCPLYLSRWIHGAGK